jgi:Acetyltransferase (GNAT) family.
MELREYTDFNQEEILSLYTSVGWENYTRNPQMLERAYENSFLKIAAFEGKQLIGMVRVVGDGASVILIQDLLVRPEYQRKGIGSQLMRVGFRAM